MASFSYGGSASGSAVLMPSEYKPYPTCSIRANMLAQQAYNSEKEEDGKIDLAGMMSTLTADSVQELVTKDPGCLQVRGFNGLLPLHSATLVAGVEVTRALIAAGADVNAGNNYGETAFHFACRRGNVPMMHFLLEAGADPSATDHAGHGPVHYCVQGGVVCGLHYLLEVVGMSSRPVSTAVPPLHIALANGRTEAFNYLMRHGRSDVNVTDSFGNTTLHVAASRSNESACWQLLTSGGMTSLRQQNMAGQSALDLAIASKAYHAEATINLLSYYTRKSATSEPRGPVLAWYAHLVVPALLYQLALVVSSHAPWPGLVIAVSCGAMLLLLSRHIHRMKHACRWPNPMHAGLFVTGFVHTVACFYSEVLHDTYFERPFLTVSYTALVMFVIYLYMRLMLRDPGLVKESARKSDGSGFFSVLDIGRGLLKQDRFCSHCELVLPTRCRHCRLCGRCYYRLDHHCLFLYQCVAYCNQRVFMTFVLLVTVIIVTFLSVTVWRLTSGGVWLWSMFAANVVWFAWAIALISQQAVFLSCDGPRVYRPTRGRQLYALARFVLTGRRPESDNHSKVTIT